VTTTHDDDATTWRDLADQMTPEQIAELELREQRWPDEHKGILIEAQLCRASIQNTNSRAYHESKVVMYEHVSVPYALAS
jgi:hypothetical protein